MQERVRNDNRTILFHLTETMNCLRIEAVNSESADDDDNDYCNAKFEGIHTYTSMNCKHDGYFFQLHHSTKSQIKSEMFVLMSTILIRGAQMRSRPR